MFHERKRQLLGQYRDGEFLPYLESRIDLPQYISDQESSTKGYL